jgi:hypothetical protein
MRFGLFLLVLLLDQVLWARPNLIINETSRPLSICDGSLRALVNRAIAAQPSGYVDPRGIELEHYKATAPSALFCGEGHAHVEIAELLEIPSTYLVLASERRILNLLLSRASAAIEHRMPQTDREFLDSPRLFRVGGVDLQSQDLERFYRDVMKGKLKKRLSETFSKEEKIQLGIERRFWREWLWPKLRDRSREFVVVSAPAHRILARRVASHEFLHAIFFTNPQFRKAIFKFWREHVEAKDRAFFISKLKSHYPEMPRNETLAANFFR